MNIKLIQILEKIISAGGSCDGHTPSDCRICPLGKARKQDNGSPMGCIEYLSIEGLSEAQANAKYLTAASKALADLEMDRILGEDDGTE